MDIAKAVLELLKDKGSLDLETFSRQFSHPKAIHRLRALKENGYVSYNNGKFEITDKGKWLLKGLP